MGTMESVAVQPTMSVLGTANTGSESLARDALVSTEWVAKHHDDPSMRLIEVDEDTTLYEKGHVPGSLAWNWTTQLNDLVRRDIPSRGQFEQLLRRSGVTKETTVVLYGENHNWFAAYAAWLLAFYGHADVRLMDGGRKKWVAEQRPFVTDHPTIVPTQYRIERTNEHYRATRDLVLEGLRRGDLCLVDVRSPDEYSGKIMAPPGLKETALRGGHIPGAVSVPWSKAVNEDSTFRSRAELETLYAAVLGTREVFTYCRIGERSAHTWFVLHRLLGVERVRNYDGSWTEYGNLIGAPINLGPSP